MQAADHKQMFFQPGISPTSINQYYEKVAEFWRFSSLNPQKERKEATEPMIFGRLVHCLVLTPEMYDSDFVIMPEKGKEDLETVAELKAFILPKLEAGQKIKSDAKKEDLVTIAKTLNPFVRIWSEVQEKFIADNKKKAIITKEQLKNAESMQAAMRRNKTVSNLIGNGFSEEPFCWFPEGEAGLMLKAKLDYVRSGLVIEYKTDVSPGEADFQRTIANRGYHRQLAMQAEACKLRDGEAPRGAIIIAQDKEYHDDIAVYALDAMSLARGREEVYAAYNDIKRRLKTGNWRSYEDTIKPISLPGYYRSKAVMPTEE